MADRNNRGRGLTDAQAQALTDAAAAAQRYREDLPDAPARPTVDLDSAVAKFLTGMPETGSPEDEVIAHIIRDAEGAIHSMARPSFYGYVLGGSHPVGVAADFLVSAWGQNAGSSFETPAVTGMERAVCDWVIDLLSLPPESGAGLVTGGTVANMVGIMSARHALLAARGWDVEADGLFGAPEFPILIGADAHSAPFAALRYAGLGAARAKRVATDAEGRIKPAALEKALADCDAPPLVVLQAGQINTGAFDPFAELIPLVREKKGWVHVDGAFGLWLAAVPDLRDRLAHVGDADSWAVDLHKWLNAPFDAGMVIVRDRAPLVASMSARGAYLPDTTAHWEPSDSTPELSRRARGIPSYAILRHLGRAGVRELVARHCRLAARIAAKVSAHPGISVLNEIHSNQVAIACGDGPDGDDLTMRVLHRVQDRGKVYPTHGEWAGRKIIRVSVIGYAMQDEDADLLASEIIGAYDVCVNDPA
ncbi:aspartate aminotransferase family protein [Loktanella sp. IMCC34160]|uniref:pyridoxal phosphate-dependent decarboxylase family protein n=1 Tax=Loktanella sp. IMCC34160 TaxID=2510646 RepID=UPI00101CAF14|nr:aminotransferase class V-fold PLP-dependent enzyme [Loktanella sp. IMCC34160]RYG92994.1 aspartate aminotransferase family protein [Loktanella sp. IMCC34160]